MRSFLALCLLAPGLLAVQAPRIGVIDFHGLRHVSEKRLREALAVREGDPLPASKGALEERLEHVAGVVHARLDAVCCEGDRVILYVGIEEKEAPHFEFKPEPSGDATLPEPVSDSYRFLLAALERAARDGPVSESLLHGHALSSDPAVRAIQERLQFLAADHLDRIRQVLRESGDASQRAAAACVIGYAPTKRLVVDDLQSAMRDPDESVRASAMRSLAAIAVLGALDKELGIRVEPTWFIQMLNSLVWSDRTRAAAALVSQALRPGSNPGNRPALTRGNGPLENPRSRPARFPTPGPRRRRPGSRDSGRLDPGQPRSFHRPGLQRAIEVVSSTG
jgi:hypothetical protein